MPPIRSPERTRRPTLVVRNDVGASGGASAGAASNPTNVAETEQLARMSDAYSRSRPAAQPPTVAPNRSSSSTTRGTMKPHVLLATHMGAPPPRVELSAEERLRALVDPNAAHAPASTPPKPKQLASLVTQLGPAAKALSAEEVALALGQPSWKDAIAALDPPVTSTSNGARAPHFLLAAQLARWMEGIYAGASQEDVVESFKSAHPDVAARFPHLDKELLELMQRAYAFMPAWRSKPEPKTAPTNNAADWLAVPNAGALYAERLEKALQQLSEVPLTMPLTSTVGERLAEDQRFKGHNVVMVQHMLGQANPFLDAMCRAGLEVDKADFVGVPYQQNPAVRLTLERTYGVKVDVPPTGDMEAMWHAVGAAIDRAVARNEQNGEPILVLDDGGYASKYIAEKYPDKAHLFKVVEQTTRGLTEIKKLPPEAVQFPIVDVAGSYGKRFEAAQVGDAVVQCIRRVLDEVQKTPTRKDVLIVGAGKVGLGVADSFKGDGARVSIYDPYLSPQRKAQLEKLGYHVITERAEALSDKFLVVGCSGHRSIDMSDFAKMCSPVFLASASSKQVEIDILGLKELATDKDGKVRRILAAKVNEQETWHYWTQDGRIVTTLADGLPVNFQDVNSIAPELIDHTMALMLLAAGQAVNQKGKGLQALDSVAQFEVQAQMEGLTREQRGANDVAITVAGMKFWGNEARWRAIAESPATPPEVITAIVMTKTLPVNGSGMDAGLYRFDMSPTLLLALETPKAVNDDLVDHVLSRGFLPHIAHLARNPELTEEQTRRVLAYVEKALQWVHDGVPEDKRVSPDPTAALLDSSGVLRPAFAGVPGGVGLRRETMVYGFRPGDVAAQLASILYTHPACPQKYLDAFTVNARDRLGTPSAETIYLLRNPRWTASELKHFCDSAQGPLMRLIPKQTYSARELEFDPFVESQLGDLREMGDVAAVNKNGLFAFDVADVIAHHANADDNVQVTARSIGTTVAKSFEDNLVLRGVASWRPDATGVPVPDYV